MSTTQAAKQVWEWIGNNLWTVIIFLSIFIQITPIKWNPLSSLIKWAGKILVGDACGKIDGVANSLKKLETEVRENEKDRIRWEILDFANSCHNGRKHTKDEFDHIITLNTKYRRLLEHTHDENGVFELEYAYIVELYKELIHTDSFLK